jgi:hypothetical protein
MDETTIIGLALAKSVFQAHGESADETLALGRRPGSGSRSPTSRA